MMQERPLTLLFKQFKNKEITKSDLEGRIFQYLLKNLARYRLFGRNRECWEDFLSWLYPRLARAIDQYHDIGSSFDAYISAIINGVSKEYRRREADHTITELTCWQAKAEEICDNETEYSGWEPHELSSAMPSAPAADSCDTKDISLCKRIHPRQILVLALKSYYCISQEMVGKVSQATGIDYKEINTMIQEIKKLRSIKDKEILELRERVYCQHYRVLAYQKRMQCAQDGSDYQYMMKDRFERARKRYFTMKKRLQGIRRTASNRMIAAILGIPRGTVDTTLSAVKNRRLNSADKAV